MPARHRGRLLPNWRKGSAVHNLRFLADDLGVDHHAVIVPDGSLLEPPPTQLAVVDVAKTPKMNDLIKRANFRIKIRNQVSENLSLNCQARGFVNSQAFLRGTILYGVGSHFYDHLFPPGNVFGALASDSFATQNAKKSQ